MGFSEAWRCSLQVALLIGERYGCGIAYVFVFSTLENDRVHLTNCGFDLRAHWALDRFSDRDCAEIGRKPSAAFVLLSQTQRSRR